MSCKKALVFGSNGLLGQAFLKQLKEFDIEFMSCEIKYRILYWFTSYQKLTYDNLWIKYWFSKQFCSNFFYNKCKDVLLRGDKINSDLVNFLASACSNLKKVNTKLCPRNQMKTLNYKILDQSEVWNLYLYPLINLE